MGGAGLSAGPDAAPVEGRDWFSFGGDDNGEHYSPLGQITTANVGKLGLAWSYDLDTFDGYTEPLAVNGVLYFAVGHSVIHALDARSGKLLWKYDPKVAESEGAQWRMRAGWGIRGIAFRDGKVITATRDGRLLAVDARSGKLAWSVQTLDEPISHGAYIAGPPLVAGGVVVIGFGGGDYSAVRGYVTGYDLKTGKKLWRFYTVPGNPANGFEDKAQEQAAKTWNGDWWKFGGGGAVWHAMTYDAKYDRVYIGTGNGLPWNAKIRSPGGGDNLYIDSIVALDAKSGKYAWHYQVSPGDSSDFDNDEDMALTTMVVKGQKHDVLLQAPKNGFYYVIDRANGKLLTVKNFAQVNWAKDVDEDTGRPDVNPESLYPDGKPAIVYPFPNGAHGVQSMAHSPQTGLTYIPVMVGGRVQIDPPNIKDWKFKDGMFVNTGLGAPPPGLVVPPARSTLLAWNPQTQKKAWEIPQPNVFNGGVLATGGRLIFQGLNTGDFAAYDAANGEKLWSFDAKNGILAAPISYSAGGRQYVTVIASFRSSFANQPNWDYRQQKRRVLTFALGGHGKLPTFERVAEPIVDDPAFVIDPAKAAIGAGIFNAGCNICHGGGMIAGGAAPDLRKSPIPLDKDAFYSVVHEGALMNRGMGRFAHLSDAELEGLRHFIRQRARATMPTK
ncbi:MAG: PQQ-binding-like beta-propeller repeat protein [Sphingomonadales bacterium]|nr:PQQ-binding-like beta-propeller repeat protein [Sphingomonadales bacterium]